MTATFGPKIKIGKKSNYLTIFHYLFKVNDWTQAKFVVNIFLSCASIKHHGPSKTLKSFVVVKGWLSRKVLADGFLKVRLQVLQLDRCLLREERATERSREGQTHSRQEHSSWCLQPWVLNERLCLLQDAHDHWRNEHSRRCHPHSRGHYLH